VYGFGLDDIDYKGFCDNGVDYGGLCDVGCDRFCDMGDNGAVNYDISIAIGFEA